MKSRPTAVDETDRGDPGMDGVQRHPSFRTFGIALSAAILAYGIYASGIGSAESYTKWIAITLCLFAVPLACQFLASRTMAIYALWFGLFLVVQSAASPLIFADTKYFKTLPPNLTQRVEVGEGALAGIEGRRQITTDAQGFRSWPPLDYSVKQGRRIFAIGGSTTECGLLDDSETWAYVMQETLADRLSERIEVSNTGVSGLRAIHHLATLERVATLDADMALFLMGVNDWNKHIREQFGSTFYASRDHHFQVSVLGRALNMVFDLFMAQFRDPDAVLFEDGGYYTLQQDSLSRAEKRDFKPTEVSADYVHELNMISATCHESGIECVFITQPHGYGPGDDDAFLQSFWMTPPNEDYTLTLESLAHIADLYNNYLISFGAANGHAVIDLAASIEPSFDNFYDDVHFNTQGARKVGETLGHALADLAAPAD